MRRTILMVAVVVSFGATACGKETIRLPEGRPGSMNVGGAVRARSSHYQLIGTLSPTGGSHAASGIQLHDGVFVNQNK